MKKLLIFLISVFLYVSVFSQEDTQNTIFEPVSETIENLGFFGNETPLDLTLKYDITSFIKNKQKSEYLDAELQIHFSEAEPIIKNIRLKARGNFRKGYCFFPPIYLNFKTDPIKQTELQGIKKMKLVTHCSSSKTFQNYIFKEYLAYKLYSVLTDKSFRVKLVHINYIDTGKKGRDYHTYGFLIEPLDLILKRTNAVEIDGKHVRGENIAKGDADRVALFEYMIANTDWRFKSGHNMKYIKLLDVLSNDVIPVPYDFDYSGIVNTSYAHPQEWTSIEHVTDREYLGYCRPDNEDYLKAIKVFTQNKEKILDRISSFEFLPDKEKKRIEKFVRDFYGEIEDERMILGNIKGGCRDINF